MPKLRQLRAVVEIEHAGSVGHAAATLNMSQPAVSRSIRTLEDELGIALFTRTRKRMLCTEAGAILIKRSARALDHLRAAELELQGARRSEQRALGPRPLSVQAADHELRAVINVAQFGRVTTAASRLTISQPAVNRSLTSLERRLGQPLFHRTPEGMAPTPAGTIVIRRAKLAFSEIRQAKEEIAALLGESRWRVRLGVLPLARVRLVPLAVHRLLQDHPGIEVAIVDGTYGSLLGSLRSGDIDVIVGTIRVPPPADDVGSEELFQDDLVIVSGSGHPVQKRSQVQLADLLTGEWVLPFKGVPIRARFEALLEQERLALPARVIETASLAAMRTLLLQGDRYALVSRHQIFFEEATGLLSPVPLTLTPMPRPVGLTMRRDFVPTPVMQALLGHLRAVAAEIDAVAPREARTTPPPPAAAKPTLAHASSGTSSR